MSNGFEWQFCNRCQRYRVVMDLVPPANELFSYATLGMVPLLLGLIRQFALPKRCGVCFAPWRLRFTSETPEPLSQSQAQIDERLSIFDRRIKRYATDTIEVASKDSVATFADGGRYRLDHLEESGFSVGGKHERILHVARIHPEFFLDGYVAKFFYLLFIPLTFWHLRHRRARNPHAHFFPLDHHRAGRVVLTDKRLVAYCDMNSYYYRYVSIPHEAIREVRQHRSSIRLQMQEPGKETITINVGDDLGLLLRAIHTLSTLSVRGPDEHWSDK